MEESAKTDSRVLLASCEKRIRLREWMRSQNLDALILARRENFSWVTTGGDAAVVNTTDRGVGCLLFTHDRHYLISHSMDAERLLREQIDGQDYEPVTLRWYEGDPLARAIQISSGNVATDIEIKGTRNVFQQVVDLHYPLKSIEIERLRLLGQSLHSIYVEMGNFIQAGMSEMEIAAYFQYLQALQEISSDVLICGCDERLFHHRHPMPSHKALHRYLILHSAARKWGLHAPVTRLFSIGHPDDDFAKPFQAAASIQARMINTLKPGVPYSTLLHAIKKAYEESGYVREWENHFQGGPTGYIIVDGTRLLSSHKVEDNTPFEWFFTVPGSKVAELTILENGRAEIASAGEKWPAVTIEDFGIPVNIPGVFVLGG